jgi:FAD/FMN-containing dehydrogenase
MTTIEMAARSVTSVARELRQVMRGKVVLAGDDTYPQVRKIWNGAIDHQPTMFALCETVEDVQAALRIARDNDLPLSVRGGGHDWAGRSLRDGGLVIDLSVMRQVEVDPGARLAKVAGGATGAEVVAAATPHGLAAVTGNVGAVGMAGFLLGGGYGPLTTRFGLGLDNLVGAELVLADGRIVWTDATQNRDLFWAIRGGGGNFGVVTSMHIRLHPINNLLAGIILFPWSQAESVLRGHAEIMASAPKELSVLAGVFHGQGETPVVLLGPIWSGGPEEGQRIMTRLEKLGTPILSQVGPMSYPELLALYNAQAYSGLHYAVQTRWLADLTPEVISAITKAGGERTSPLSLIALHHFHGAGTRVPADATAFGLRKEHFLMEMVAVWDPSSHSDATLHRQWVSDFSARIAPLALPGGYPNLLTRDAHEQVAAAYGDNAHRLTYLKRKFDPENVFSSATPLPA